MRKFLAIVKTFFSVTLININAHHFRSAWQSKISKLFVEFKDKSTGEMTITGLESALQQFREGQSENVLQTMGLGPENLAKILCFVVLVLLLLFVFIFMGIIAFTTPGGFTSSVNSILPVLAGAGASKSQEAPSKKEDMPQEELAGAVESAVKLNGPSTL